MVFGMVQKTKKTPHICEAPLEFWFSRRSDLLSLDLPDLLSVLGNRTVRGELAGVADVDPALSCPCEVVLIILVELVACLTIVIEVAQYIIRIAGLPVGAVDETVEEVVEHSCAFVIE